MSIFTLLEMLLICSSHLQLLWRVIPRCLWCGLSSSTTFPNVSWCIGFVSRLMFTSSVFSSLNFTFQSFAQSLIFTRSHVSISALVSGFVRPTDILVSSANSLMMDSILCPMSLMNIKNKRGPSTDPWGTPAGIFFSEDFSPLLLFWPKDGTNNSL